MQKHKIQYRTTGRVIYNNENKGVSSYFYLEDVPGNSLQEARKNGLDTANHLAQNYLLEDARKKFNNPNLQIDDIQMTIDDVK